MEKMDSIKEIKENLQTIFKDEVRLYSLKGVEKTSMLLGVISIVIYPIVLAGKMWLNLAVVV